MIKDIVVNLTVDAATDVAADYAVSVARAFDAHVTGIGFAYDVFLPGSIFGTFRSSLPTPNAPRMSRRHEPRSPVSRRLCAAPGSLRHRMC